MLLGSLNPLIVGINANKVLVRAGPKVLLYGTRMVPTSENDVLARPPRVCEPQVECVTRLVDHSYLSGAGIRKSDHGRRPESASKVTEGS